MKRALALATMVLLAFAISIPVFGDPVEHKILICHLPPGNPENGQVIEIDQSAWEQGGPPGHHAAGNHGGDFAITSDEDLAKCEGKDDTTTTTKPEETTTTKHEDTTTTRKDTTTTEPEETTTTEPDETTTTTEETTTTSEDSTTTTEGSTTSTVEGTTSTTEASTTTTQPTTTTTGIQLGLVDAVCVSDIPFLSYGVEFPGATEVDIVFDNPSGPDVVYLNQPLTGQVLWPGASDVPPFDWPGWILGSDGVWVEGDDGFLWARETVTITFIINPEVSTTVSYPPASAICAGPENAPTTLVPTTPSPEDTIGPKVGVLPFTGAELLAYGSIAGVAIVLGLLLVLASRKGKLD